MEKRQAKEAREVAKDIIINIIHHEASNQDEGMTAFDIEQYGDYFDAFQKKYDIEGISRDDMDKLLDELVNEGRLQNNGPSSQINSDFFTIIKTKKPSFTTIRENLKLELSEHYKNLDQMKNDKNNLVAVLNGEKNAQIKSKFIRDILKREIPGGRKEIISGKEGISIDDLIDIISELIEDSLMEAEKTDLSELIKIFDDALNIIKPVIKTSLETIKVGDWINTKVLDQPAIIIAILPEHEKTLVLSFDFESLYKIGLDEIDFNKVIETTTTWDEIELGLIELGLIEEVAKKLETLNGITIDQSILPLLSSIKENWEAGVPLKDIVANQSELHPLIEKEWNSLSFTNRQGLINFIKAASNYVLSIATKHIMADWKNLKESDRQAIAKYYISWIETLLPPKIKPAKSKSIIKITKKQAKPKPSKQATLLEGMEKSCKDKRQANTIDEVIDFIANGKFIFYGTYPVTKGNDIQILGNGNCAELQWTRPTFEEIKEIIECEFSNIILSLKEYPNKYTSIKICLNKPKLPALLDLVKIIDKALNEASKQEDWSDILSPAQVE